MRYNVVTNYFNSKGGDQSLYGANQPLDRTLETQRNARVEIVRTFTEELLAVDLQANLVAMGDLNDLQSFRALEILPVDGPLYNPVTGSPS